MSLNRISVLTVAVLTISCCLRFGACIRGIATARPFSQPFALYTQIGEFLPFPEELMCAHHLDPKEVIKSYIISYFKMLER